jgi:hypothetical protein
MMVIADTLRVHADPRADSPEAGPPLVFLEKIVPAGRLRSVADFDWFHLAPNATYPNGGWVQAEFLARSSSGADPIYQSEVPPIGQEPVDRDNPLPPDYRPNDLVQLAPSLTHAGREVFVRAATARAIEALIRRAEAEGLQLRVLSGFRSFEHQRRLYLEAITERGPKQNGTAMPGHSEHQLGTTVDFCGPDIRTHLNGSFGRTRESRFLQRLAPEHGFRNSYTAENSEQSGYKPEPWHWRHVEER